MNLFKMMSALKDFHKLQTEVMNEFDTLKDELFTKTAGGGMVTVTLSGTFRVHAVKIDASLLRPEDKELVEEFVLEAMNEALLAAIAHARDTMIQRVKGRLDAAGLGFMGGAG